MTIISKEYTWNIKDNFIYICNYKKKQNLKIIFYNDESKNEDCEELEDCEDCEESEDCEEDETEDSEESEESEDSEDSEKDNINIVININDDYDDDNVDYLNAKNLLNSIILPRTYSYKHLIVPVQYYRNNNKIIVLGSHAITNLELLRTLYEFYNVKVLTKDELDEINNDDYWNFVDKAKELNKSYYSNTIGSLIIFDYIERIENDIFRLELYNKY
jgi:hypothetical protein